MVLLYKYATLYGCAVPHSAAIQYCVVLEITAWAVHGL